MPRAQSIADQVIRQPSGGIHALFLHIAGELVLRGVALELVPAIIGAISTATRIDTNPGDREKAARTTLERWSTGDPIRGLQHDAPHVLEAVIEATATGSEARAYATRAAMEAAPEAVDLAKLAQDIDDAIANAADGCTLIVAACGLGKTRAAERVAQARYEVDSTSRLNTRTSILCPTNELAKQVHGHIPNSVRLFGALSVRGPDECKIRDIVLPLVAGGQSLSWNFCTGRGRMKCQHYDGCRAREAIEGDPESRVTVATQAKMSQVAGKAGSTELVIIDEPPPTLIRATFTDAEFNDAAGLFEAFEEDYIEGMREAFEVLRAWLAEASTPNAPTPEQPARVDLSAVFPEGHRNGGTSPRLRFAEVRRARWQSSAYRRRLGRASSLLDAVYQWHTAERSTAYVEHHTSPQLVLVYPNAVLERTLRRNGRVVLLDANGEKDVPIYTAILGYPPHRHKFDAPDGAPIERTLIYTPRANRKGWCTFDEVIVNDDLLSAVQSAVTWALETPCPSLAIVTMVAVESVLRQAAGHPADPNVPAVPPHPRAHLLAPIMAQLGTTSLTFGHYGALRGLDHMADCDALVTLGDPWFNVGAVEADVAFMGTGAEQSSALRQELLCKAELEQAHGRLRVIHRTKPGRAVHIGTVLPSGAGWKGSRLVRAGSVAASASGPVTVDLDRLQVMVDAVGGCAPVSKYLRLDRKMIDLCLKGQRVLSVKHLNDLEYLYRKYTM